MKRRLLEDAASHDPGGIARTLRYTTTSAACGDRLSENRVRTRLLLGTQERRFVEVLDARRDQFSKLEIIELAAAHAVNLGDPDGFNRGVVEFVERYSA